MVISCTVLCLFSQVCCCQTRISHHPPPHDQLTTKTQSAQTKETAEIISYFGCGSQQSESEFNFGYNLSEYNASIVTITLLPAPLTLRTMQTKESTALLSSRPSSNQGNRYAIENIYKHPFGSCIINITNLIITVIINHIYILIAIVVPVVNKVLRTFSIDKILIELN